MKMMIAAVIALVFVLPAFIGPSGCGKSTLLKTLNRMNDPVEGCRIEGKAFLDGEDIWRYGCD